MDNIKRQKIVERDDFKYEERMEIQAKSKDKCCHCGKTCFPGYGATVEHFIPLAKGGTNRMLNLVMLCEDCNKEKGAKIYEPYTYLKYLEEPYKKQIEDYFDSYVRSFEYFENKNVLACDRYEYAYYPPYTGRKSFNKKKLHKQPPAMKVRLDKIDFDPFTENAEIKEAIEYMKKYLEKRGIDKDPEEVVLAFVNQGCLYSMRKTEGIACLAGVVIRTNLNLGLAEDNKPSYDVAVCIMPLYNTEAGFNIANTLAKDIPLTIIQEQGLNYLSCSVCAFKEEPWISYFCRYFDYSIYKGKHFIETRLARGTCEDPESCDQEKTHKFLEAVYREPVDAPGWFKKLATTMW